MRTGLQNQYYFILANLEIYLINLFLKSISANIKFFFCKKITRLKKQLTYINPDKADFKKSSDYNFPCMIVNFLTRILNRNWDFGFFELRLTRVGRFFFSSKSHYTGKIIKNLKSFWVSKTFFSTFEIQVLTFNFTVKVFLDCNVHKYIKEFNFKR